MFVIINKSREILHQCPQFNCATAAAAYVRQAWQKNPDTYIFGYIEVFHEDHYTMEAVNNVETYFYYMWNSWDEKEASVVFPQDTDHFWRKYKEFTRTHGTQLLKRACELYDGSNRKETR